MNAGSITKAALVKSLRSSCSYCSKAAFDARPNRLNEVCRALLDGLVDFDLGRDRSLDLEAHDRAVGVAQSEERDQGPHGAQQRADLVL